MNPQTERRGIDWSAGVSLKKEEPSLEHFWNTHQWGSTTIIAFVLGLIAVMSCVFVIYRGYFGNIDTRIERSIIVSLLELYVFLKLPIRRKWNARLNSFFAIDLILCLLVVVTQVYTIHGTITMDTQNWWVTLFGSEQRIDHIAGIIVLVLLFEATRRSFGWVMVGLPLAFIVYSLFGGYMPGPLKAISVSWTHMSEMLYVLNEGVYGIGTEVLLSMIFLYILFGVFVAESRTGAFFTAAADALVGRFAGGPAKVSVIGSAAMGTITGSAIANVVTTGSITIPMMKKMGFKPEFAGAVETCASTAGYFTPPIMGAAAFLIAVFTNTPYIVLCLYCAIPAALYYTALFLQVHFRAKKDNLRGLDPKALPSLRRVMLDGGHLVFPLLLIIVALTIGYSVTRVAVWGILAVIIVSLFRPETRLTPKRILITMENMVSSNIGVIMSIIITGVIQGALMATGLGFRLSSLVQSASMGSMIFGLVIAAVISLILGTGLPAVLVYYICVAFIIPALIGMGAPVLPSHVFALMFGAMAMITPPVCVAAFTAAAIAGAGPMRTGLAATRLGFAGYVVPFMFVFNPAIMLLGGSPLTSIVSILLSIVALAAAAAAFEGYLLHKATMLERVILTLGALGLIAVQFFWGRNMDVQVWVSAVSGLALTALGFVLQVVRGSVP
ncbi:MAG: TRAP transporter fused permease subunit [Chloroflexota bacterium]